MITKERKTVRVMSTTGIHIAQAMGEVISRGCTGDLAGLCGDGKKTIRFLYS